MYKNIGDTVKVEITHVSTGKAHLLSERSGLLL